MRIPESVYARVVTRFTKVGEGWGITSQSGYRRIFLDGDQDGDTGFNELSVSVGVRFGL